MVRAQVAVNPNESDKKDQIIEWQFKAQCSTYSDLTTVETHRVWTRFSRGINFWTGQLMDADRAINYYWTHYWTTQTIRISTMDFHFIGKPDQLEVSLNHPITSSPPSSSSLWAGCPPQKTC